MSQPSLTLVTLGGAFGMRNVSPFCLKVELLMTRLGLSFELEEQPDPRKAPKGKLPYLKSDGAIYADSEIIMAHLDELTGKVYGDLTAQQKAYGVALSRLAEEHLYWIMVASRWLDDAWWPNVVEGFFGIAPKPLRGLIANGARKQVRQTYRLQGLGLHSFDEQQAFAHRDLTALQDAISPEGFLFGDTPGIYDFAVASILSGIYDNEPATWMTQLAESYGALQDYTQRVQAHVGVFGKT